MATVYVAGFTLMDFESIFRQLDVFSITSFSKKFNVEEDG